jgi:S-adenosylmethionine hydrolase
VASLKATLLKGVPELNIVDITHEVEPFNSGEAAYHVSACVDDFPAGTIHIIGVDSEPSVNFGSAGGAFPSIMKYKDQIFISNDNGFFGSLLNEEQAQGFYRIDNVLSNKDIFRFPTKNILCKAAVELANGAKIEAIASEHDNYTRAFIPVALEEQNLIKGHVIHVDSYGNLITNISRGLFDSYGKDEPFTIYFKSQEYYIDTISLSYNEVPQGEKVALFNDSDLLEIAINRAANRGTGGAEKLFGLGIGDIVRVKFTPRGSHDTINSLFDS